MEKFQIHSIYRATEGEGIHIGNPLIFVRFQGCAVGCLNCDSKETWDFHPEKTLSKEFVIKKVKELAGSGIKRLTLTGGDPLHPKLINEVKYLAREFKALGFWVNLEAAGTRVEEELFKICDFISYDLKTPSTGVRTSWDLAVSAIEKFWNKIQIKAVIENKKDFEYYQEFQTLLLRSLEPNIYLKLPLVITPSFLKSEKTPHERIQSILTWNEESGAGFRVICQQHKLIYGSERLDI